MGTQADTTDREWVLLQLRLLREATHKAADAARQWREMNAALEDWADRSNLTDPIQRARVKGANLALSDARAAWSFWQQETVRIAAAIQGELAGRTLLGQAARTADPTGLLYDRADDDELPARPAPGPRPPGWAVTGRGPHPTVPVDVPAVRL